MTRHASPVRPGQSRFDRSENLETPGLHPTLKVSKKQNQACLVGMKRNFPISFNNRTNLSAIGGRPGSELNLATQIIVSNLSRFFERLNKIGLVNLLQRIKRIQGFRHVVRKTHHNTRFALFV